MENKENEVHYLVKLALDAIRNFIESGRFIKPDFSQHPELKEKAGVFVSLKKGGQLRGCIGTLAPVTGSLGEEIVHNAVSSATKDPRFSPVTAAEIDELSCSVDVMGEPELVYSTSELDPDYYGIIVKSGGRQGLLLPCIEGINTVEEQIEIAKRKAGIGTREYVEIYKFKTERYK